MDTLQESKQKINGHLPAEMKQFFLNYRKERKHRFNSVSELFKYYLGKYLDKPSLFKYNPEQIEMFRRKLQEAEYRNNTNIYLTEEDVKRLEKLAFANYRTVTAQFNLFLFSLYFRLKK